MGEPDFANVMVIITDSLGYAQAIGTIPVDVDEHTQPAGIVQTAGSDSDTITVSTDGSASDANGHIVNVSELWYTQQYGYVPTTDQTLYRFPPP